VTPEALVAELAERIASVPAAPWTRVAVDGAPHSGTGDLADALIEPLRLRGRHAIRIRAADYLRSASLRFEHGRHDPDAYYSGWIDFNGLRREVLDPLAAGGTGEVLPALWDAEADRSPREDRVPLPERSIALVEGPLLLGAGLDFDFAVHLWLPGAALERHLPEEDRWKRPAFERYSAEVGPERIADHLVRTDRPGRPAVVDGLDA
jgi:hypothetical protein